MPGGADAAAARISPRLYEALRRLPAKPTILIWSTIRAPLLILRPIGPIRAYLSSQAPTGVDVPLYWAKPITPPGPSARTSGPSPSGVPGVPIWVQLTPSVLTHDE